MLEHRIAHARGAPRRTPASSRRSEIPTGVVGIGTKVRLRDMDAKETIEYHDRRLGRGEPGRAQALERVAGRQGDHRAARRARPSRSPLRAARSSSRSWTSRRRRLRPPSRVLDVLPESGRPWAEPRRGMRWRSRLSLRARSFDRLGTPFTSVRLRLSDMRGYLGAAVRLVEAGRWNAMTPSFPRSASAPRGSSGFGAGPGGPAGPGDGPLGAPLGGHAVLHVAAGAPPCDPGRRSLTALFTAAWPLHATAAGDFLSRRPRLPSCSPRCGRG